MAYGEIPQRHHRTVGDLDRRPLIREREHGTVEPLLVMSLTPLEIMLATVWAMGWVVVLAATASIRIVVQGGLDVPLPLAFKTLGRCRMQSRFV